MITLADIERLSGLEKAATPGKWKRMLLLPTPGQTWLGIGTDDISVCLVSGIVESPVGNRNVAFIAAARNALPELLDLAREHMRLVSVLGFLNRRTFPLRELIPEAMYEQATEAGWTFDAPEQAKEEA